MLAIFSVAAVLFTAITASFRAGQRTLHFTGAVITGILSGLGLLLLRDLLASLAIATILIDETYIVMAILGGCLGFLLSKYFGGMGGTRKIFATLEAISLGLATSVGLIKGLSLDLPMVGCLLLAVFTGIAGSIMRDFCLSEMPLTIGADFHFMATAIGAMFGYALIMAGCAILWAAIATICITMLICLFGFWKRTKTGHADLDY